MEQKTERVGIMFEPSLLKDIDDYRFSNRIGSRANAVRQLIELGLKCAHEAKKDEVTA